MLHIKEILEKYRRYLVICFGILFILFFYGCYTYSAYSGYIKPISGKVKKNLSVYSKSEDTRPVILQKGDRLVQTFKLDENGMSAILIQCRSDNPQDGGNVLVELEDSDTGTLVKQWEKPLNELRETGFVKFRLEEQVELRHGYNITIMLDDKSDRDTLTLFCSKEDSLESGTCAVNNVIEIGDINFKVNPAYVNNHFLLKWFALICISMIILTVFVWCKIMIGKRYKVEHIFLVFILIIGTIYVFVMPPFSVPDEPTHYMTSYYISNKIMGVKESVDEVVCRESDIDEEGMITTSASLSAYRYINDTLAAGNTEVDNNGTIHVGYVISCARQAHLPQALGITVARLLRLSYSGLLISGRMFAVLFYAAMTFFAIKIIPVGKSMLFAVSSVPMLLHEVASFSYDCNILAMAFLLTSYLLYLIYEKEKLELKDYIIVSVLSILLAPCKMVYFPIVLLAVAIPGKKFGNRIKMLFVKAGVPFAAVIAAILGNVGSLANVSGSGNVVVWADEEGYTISYVLTHIPQTIKIYLDTLYDKMEFYFDSMIGSSLGWFQVNVPNELIVFSVVLLVISIFEYKKYGIKRLHRILFVVIFAVISALIMATMLTGWTPMSYNKIEGVQGRYFLPVLPLLLFACMFQTTKRQAMINQKIVLLGSCIINYMIVLRIFTIVANT